MDNRKHMGPKLPRKNLDPIPQALIEAAREDFLRSRKKTPIVSRWWFPWLLGISGILGFFIGRHIASVLP